MATSLGWRRNLDGQHDVSLDLLLHINRRTEAVLAQTARHLDSVTDPAAAHAHRARVRDAVLAGLGSLPEHTGATPPVTWREPFEHAGCRLRHLVYESLPGVPVTATLIEPVTAPAANHRPGERRPAVLFVCGHTADGRADPSYQQVCLRLARAGLVVLAIDPFGQGERVSYLAADGTELVARGTTEHTYAGLPGWWLGQSLARWWVHDARRAIDLLTTLDQVDPSRIGITGNSGGGTLCTWMLPIDDRLAAAAVGTFPTSRGAYLWSGQAQDAEQVLLGGTAAGVDHADLLAAMAPRPLAVLAAQFDFFPMEGTVEAMERASTAYRALGAAEALQLHTAPHAHTYSPELATAAARFFCAAFDLPAPADDETQDPVATDRMRALPRGQVALDVPGAQFVHDLLRAQAQELPAPDPATARTWLHDRVHAHRVRPRAPYPRWLPGPEGTIHGMWRSEQDLWGAAVLLPDRSSQIGPTPGPRPVRILLLDDGSDALTAARAADGALVLALDVRGRGALAPHDKDGLDPASQRSAVYKMLCDLIWLDDSLAAGQAFDLTRAIDVVLDDPYLASRYPGLGPQSPVHVEADGVLAFIAQLGAAVDDRITSVTVTDEAVDPERMLTERYWDHGRGEWQAIVPGLARHAPLPLIRTLLGERLRTG